MLKLLLITIGAAAAAALSLALGVAGVSRDRAPQRALQWWPEDSRALTELAVQALGEGELGQRRRAGDIARQAIRRDPLSSNAYAILALARAEDNASAARAMAYSASLSRRNLIPQLWFIEEAVRRNDIGRALHHYDIALRTSSRAPEILFPILAQAVREEALASALARLLARDPSWKRDFLLHAITNAPDVGAIGDLSLRSASIGHPFEPSLDSLLIGRLVNAGAFEPAFRLYRRTIAPGDSALVRNGGFERADDSTVFDWLLVDEGDLWARRAPGDTGLRLEFGAGGSRGGSVARQVLLLAPGVYRLQAEAGSLAGAGELAPALIMECATASGQQLLRAPLTTPDRGRSRLNATVSVPGSGCAAQRLRLELRGAQSVMERSGWIDAVAIAPLSRGG